MRNKIISGLAFLALSFSVSAQQTTTSKSDEPTDGLKKKEATMEVAAPKGGEIYIESSSRPIIVKTWDQQKVKVTCPVYYQGEDTRLTDEDWFNRLNLNVRTLGSSVKIKSGTIESTAAVDYNRSYTVVNGTTSSTNNITVFNSEGMNIGTKPNAKRPITIYIPAGSKIDIESKYADIHLPANVGDVNLDITNGTLEAENINKLTLRSKYSSADIGDVKFAEVEFANGRFTAKNIEDLDIESKYSTIEMASAKKATIHSSNDEYEIEEVGELHGSKNYGNLRITKLTAGIDLSGANADVRIRNLSSSVNLIKIEDKYADIRIPMRDIKNYSVDYTGSYSSVYGNFEKKQAPPKDGTANNSSNTPAPTTIIYNNGQSYNSGYTNTVYNGNKPERFVASVGDGNGTKVEMKCQNCTVDFK